VGSALFGQPAAGPAKPSGAKPVAAPKAVAPTSGLAAALEEFRVQTAPRGAAGGPGASKGGPGRPQQPTKAAWHGRVYENLRNDLFDANPHQIVQRGGDKRQLRRNQYGLSVTGPVVLPKIYNGTGKTFFTVTYEGVREKVGQFTLATIPTTLERTGSWSHVVDPNGAPLQIFDPLTTAANPLYDSAQIVSTSNLQYLRQQFPNNVIPVTRLDAAAQRVLTHLPQPNTNAGPFFQNNYFAVTPEINRANGFIISVDHSFRQKHRVTVRLNKSDGTNGNAPNFPTLANSQNPNVNVPSRGIRMDHVYTASPTSVNTFRLQADSQANRNIAQLDANGKPFPRYQFGAQGGNNQGGGNNNNNQGNNNNFNFNAGLYSNLGQNNPISRDTNNFFSMGDSYAVRWKTHRISIDGEARHRQIHSFRPQSPEGRFDFSAGYTSLPGIVNTGHAFASFLLGAASQAQQSIVISPSYYRWSSVEAAISDTWQVTRSLTVQMSVNIPYYTQRTEKYDRQSNIDLSLLNPANGRPGALVAANTNGWGRAFPPNWIKIQPGAGLTWSVLGDNNTVLRLNYNRFYNGPQVFNGHFGTQAFNGSQLYLSPNAQLAPALILSEGLRPGRFPDLRPDAANGTAAQLMDTSGIQPMAQNFQVRLQRQLARNLILSAQYTLQYGKNEFVNQNLANPNAIPTENLAFRDKLNDLAFVNSLRPYPQFVDFDVAQSFALGRHRNRNYNINLEKRTSGGFAMSVGYTNFLRYDNYSAPAQNMFDRNSAWSIAMFSRPHNVDATFLYELPFGPGKRFLTSSLIGRHILGGWALSGTSQFASGQPLRLTPQFNNTGGVIQANHLWVDVVPGVDPHLENQGPAQWFNAAAFTNPANFTMGNGPRVHPTLRGPGSYNIDMTLNKRMAIGGDRTLEFTATMLNATNHANWNQPDTRIGSATTPNFNAGKIIGSTGGRIVQLGLRINF
jgi:hypothetical protein